MEDANEVRWYGEERKGAATSTLEPVKIGSASDRISDHPNGIMVCRERPIRDWKGEGGSGRRWFTGLLDPVANTCLRPMALLSGSTVSGCQLPRSAGAHLRAEGLEGIGDVFSRCFMVG